MGEGTPGPFRTASGRLRLGWRLALFMLIAFATMLLVALVLPPTILSASAAMLAGGLVGGWVLLIHDGRGPGALGFHLSRASAPESLKGLGLGIALGLAVVGAMAALGGVRWTVQDGSPTAWLASGLGALAFLTIPAAAEEAVLRGYLLQALAETWGPITGLVITSVAFGGLHVWNPGITPLGVLNVTAAGAFLGVVYLKTASLWWATGAHLGWNWAHGYLADVPVSGLELMDAPYYEGVSRGPEWLGGGVFGPEGSAVATVLVLVAAVACWRTGRLSPGTAAAAARPLVLAAESAGEARGHDVTAGEQG